MLKKYLPIFILVVLTSCGRHSENEVSWDRLFNNIEDLAEPDKLKSFCKSTIDSTEADNNWFFEITKRAITDLPKDANVRTYLDSLIGSDMLSQSIYVTVVFYHHCHYAKLDLKSIRADYFKLIDNYMWMNHGRLVQDEKIKLARLSNSNVNIGDTVRIVFQVGDQFGKRSTYYTHGIEGKRKESKTNSTDSLVVTGNVTAKKYNELYPSGIDTCDLVFMLKILSLSNNQVLISGHSNTIGDTIPLYVTLYGKEILPFTQAVPR